MYIETGNYNVAKKNVVVWRLPIGRHIGDIIRQLHENAYRSMWNVVRFLAPTLHVLCRIQGH
jgi:hypothetical protein